MLRGAVAGLAALCAAPAMAAPAAYDIAFVSEFADACVPQRMSYPGTQDTARAGGWVGASRGDHPELDAMMRVVETTITKETELKPTFDYALFKKPIEGQEHFLVVSRSTFIVDAEEDPPDPWKMIGCYIYNFDAATAIDPEPVSALTGNAVAQSHADAELVSYSWGPPCPMPRTGDTYLSFIPDGSPFAEQAGFSGLVLKFETSEPDPGEEVPETYC